jgi:hypothetical protein
VRAFAAAALLVAASLPARGAPADAAEEALDRRREAIAREILRVGAAVRREIERGDAAALVARVPADGLRCGARVVPRARVARDLADPASWLHGVFFGGPGFRPGPRSPPSLRELLRSERDVALAVSFQRDRRSGPVGLPCLEFRAKGATTPGAPLCFEERGGRWWLAESLYPCG